jgi:outer membrane protein assembly factor BamB
MASFEIILGVAPHEPGKSPVRAESAVDELFDVVIDGERFSAASRPEQAACLLRDLVSAGIAVLEGRSPKALVPLCDAPWELCLVGDGPSLALSLYRTGPLPDVRLLDRPVAPRDLAHQARAALAKMAPRLSPTFATELAGLVARLEVAAADPAPAPQRVPDTLVRWRSRDEERPVRLAFETVISGAGASDGAAVRADLHALLFRGRLWFDIRGQRGELGAGFLFLQLERLLSLCRPLLEAYTARRAVHLRVSAGSATLGVRLGSDGRMALSITRAGGPTFTAPALSPQEFALPIVEAALALAQGVVRCDRTRVRNLRLRALRTEARALRKRIHDLGRLQGKLNDDPAPYRASAVPTAPTGPSTASSGMNLSAAARLRYAERWRAELEGIDLGGTLLCGDRIVVPGSREIHAIDRRSGALLWTKALPRAATTLAGGGILRLSSRGEVELRDVADGEVLWASRIAPRVGAPAHAFTVNATGLPRLVVLAEGERRLVALDLNTGEPRWRHTARQAGAFKIRRVGRLLIVVCGDASVTALDAATGEVVWRFVGNAPFVLPPAVHRDTVLACAGAPTRGAAQLVAIDAFTGARRWSMEHDAAAVSVPVGAADVAALALAGREGVHLTGHDLATGEERFACSLGQGALQGRAVALSAFDELLVANSPSGQVTAVEAPAGAVRWSRVLAAAVGDNAPRRLDVQLRAGALFVPQSSLAVLRPSDGATVANVEACDLVPDLLRVDEECAVYVGEESGHLGCYELGARLSVVRAVN